MFVVWLKFWYIYICVYIYIYIYIYIYVIYVIMQTMCPSFPVITTMALWQVMHLGTWCTMYMMYMMHMIYIYFYSHLVSVRFEDSVSHGSLMTPYDHLWPLSIYVYIYIYIYIYTYITYIPIYTYILTYTGKDGVPCQVKYIIYYKSSSKNVYLSKRV